MAILVPKHIGLAQQKAEKDGLIRHFNDEMEKVINKNKDKDKFWILGKVRFPPEFGGKVGRVFLDASDTKPPVIKGSFVYEVDNKKGTKELLWTHHNNSLNLIPNSRTIIT